MLYTRENPLEADILNPRDIETVRASHYDKTKGLRFVEETSIDWFFETFIKIFFGQQNFDSWLG